MHVQEVLLASASWQLCAAFCRALKRLNPGRCKNSFCGYKFNHKNFFAEGFTNRNATTSFSATKTINPYIPAETVQRSLQNQGVANGTSKKVGLGKFWLELEISEAFLISLEVSFLYGLFLLFLSLETFYQRVSGSDF